MICVALASSNSMAQGRRGGGGGGQSGGSRSAPMIISPSNFSSSTQWEYGKLEVAAGQIVWRGSGEKFEAKNPGELVAKLNNPNGAATTAPASPDKPALDKPAPDATADADDDLPLWNLLGGKGWEFVESEAFAAPTGQGHQMIYRFKRQKH
ncbi:MAG TPA: hypothetical protein VH370_12980 [Humisphaera sp.]|nr:hypothetical protein [Humisphaera sp.]